MVTLEDLQKAEQLLKDYKVCGNWCGSNSGHGCNKVFKTEEVTRTNYYGTIYFWCPDCYKKIKDD